MDKSPIDRLRALLGTQKRIADALGISEEHVSRMASGKNNCPAYLDAIAELLEALPRHEWPARWQRGEADNLIKTRL